MLPINYVLRGKIMKSFTIVLLLGFLVNICCAQSDAITFDGILNGALGSDYAQKANEIRNYDYSSAMTRGSVNLWLSLDKSVRKINQDTTMEANEKTEEIKDKIDAAYKTLERYKSVDSQETVQQENVAFLMQ